MYQQIRNIGICALLALASCQTSKRLHSHWRQADAPIAIGFDQENHAYWKVAAQDTVYYRYDRLGDTLRLRQDQREIRYLITRLHRKKMCLQRLTPYDPTIHCFFRDRKMEVGEAIPQWQYIGVERTWPDILPALKAPTLELRLKNLLLLFEEGDYLSQSTIQRLTVLPSVVRDQEGLQAQRHIIGQVERLTRRGNQFVATLKEGGIKAALPIYGQEEGRRKLNGWFTIAMEQGASARVESHADQVVIGIKGVRIGKGWLLLGLPSLTIQDNWGQMLGFRFYLGR